FFFQAEDGIRDFHVTGVQTCALPISYVAQSSIWAWKTFPSGGAEGPRRISRPVIVQRDAFARRRSKNRPRSVSGSSDSVTRTVRSEERRVGKESRSRRSA